MRRRPQKIKLSRRRSSPTKDSPRVRPRFFGTKSSGFDEERRGSTTREIDVTSYDATGGGGQPPKGANTKPGRRAPPRRAFSEHACSKQRQDGSQSIDNTLRLLVRWLAVVRSRILSDGRNDYKCWRGASRAAVIPGASPADKRLPVSNRGEQKLSPGMHSRRGPLLSDPSAVATCRVEVASRSQTPRPLLARLRDTRHLATR